MSKGEKNVMSRRRNYNEQVTWETGCFLLMFW